MKTSPPVEKPVVVLIGNYPLDRQESMLRFRNLIQERLEADGYVTESIFPARLCWSSCKRWLGEMAWLRR